MLIISETIISWSDSRKIILDLHQLHRPKLSLWVTKAWLEMGSKEKIHLQFSHHRKCLNFESWHFWLNPSMQRNRGDSGEVVTLHRNLTKSRCCTRTATPEKHFLIAVKMQVLFRLPITVFSLLNFWISKSIWNGQVLELKSKYSNF